MRLLLVHHAFPPEATGGSEIYTEGLATRLARDHEVTVLHRSSDEARDEYDRRESVREGVRVVSLNNLHRQVAGFESYRDAMAARAAADVMDESRPDLVHVGHLTGLSTGVVFEARRRDIPVVITLHDFWTLCPLGQLLDVRWRVCAGPRPDRCLGCVGPQVAPAGPRGVGRTVGRRLPLAGAIGTALARLGGSGERRVEARLLEMREVLRTADSLISPSRFLRDRMEALGVHGIEVLPNGHAPLEVPPREADPRGRVRFGFVGSAIPSKGVHVLVEAFRLLGHPLASLEVHGPFVAYHGAVGYEARIRRALGPSAGEVLRGPFPHDQIGRVLSGLDVLVVPSIWEENAPLTVQEAFLARLPLIVSDHGGLAEMVREGVDGLRFRPGDPAALAAVMRRFIEETELRERLGREPPVVPTMDDHAVEIEEVYARARRRFQERVGRVGVVVLDYGRAEDAARAARSVLDSKLRPQVIVVENGPAPLPGLPEGASSLHLPENRGYAAGMNAGIAFLREKGCDRVLLMNNDATLEPDALRSLCEAVEDPACAAAGATVLSAEDGAIESVGARFEPTGGAFRLLRNGEPPPAGKGSIDAEVLSGVALMVRISALDRVGPLDERYFHSFEDVDWSLRARDAGFELRVVLGARVRHVGSASLGRASSDRVYYAARNHLWAAEWLRPLGLVRTRWRRVLIVGRNVAFALRQPEVPRPAALAAVVQAVRDFRAGLFGPRPRTPRP